MLPKLSSNVPNSTEWMFEVKYDGFRAFLKWTTTSIQLISRNGNDLTGNFPEIISFCEQYAKELQDLLPLKLDGEIVILNTPLQANFRLLQQRGRFKQQEKIKEFASKRNATFLCFDLLKIRGTNVETKPFMERKEMIKNVFTRAGWPTTPQPMEPIGMVSATKSFQELWNKLQVEFGEGIIAKRKDNKYEAGKRVDHWLKIKNWKKITGVITGYDPSNGYFTVSVVADGRYTEIGVVKNGFQDNELETLKSLIYEKGTKLQNGSYAIPPGICIEVYCLQVDEGQFREPMFSKFRFDLQPEECTKEKVEVDLAMLPEQVEITNPEKPLWPDVSYSKMDLILHLRKLAPYMLPRIRDKKLTLIRYPHGVGDQSFYQKHRAEHTPDFVDGIVENGEEFILCNTLEGLIWIGNQGTLEFHIPFQKASSPYPDEIVFDLDPPSREEFYLAIQAAKIVKEMCDFLQIHSFVKTSGNKGLQIHIPIREGSLTYEESRVFTEAVAKMLVNHHPELFTIERLKKKRGNRLYVDFVQHAEGKTIIAPYSPRATKEGTVATPLFWEEVTDDLTPTLFTIKNVADRVLTKGCPWITFENRKEHQDVSKLKNLIQGTNEIR